MFPALPYPQSAWPGQCWCWEFLISAMAGLGHQSFTPRSAKEESAATGHAQRDATYTCERDLSYRFLKFCFKLYSLPCAFVLSWCILKTLSLSYSLLKSCDFCLLLLLLHPSCCLLCPPPDLEFSVSFSLWPVLRCFLCDFAEVTPFQILSLTPGKPYPPLPDHCLTPLFFVLFFQPGTFDFSF